MIRAHMKGSRRTAPFLPSRRTTMLMDYPSRQSSLLPIPRASHPVLLVCVYYYSHQRACTVGRHCPCQLSLMTLFPTSIAPRPLTVSPTKGNWKLRLRSLCWHFQGVHSIPCALCSLFNAPLNSLHSGSQSPLNERS